MRKEILLSCTVLSLAASAMLLGGCGSSKKEGAADPLLIPTKVGSTSCINECHAVSQDITGNPIAATWAATTHTTVIGVQCEDCHGAASLHRGVGPILFPNPPASQCAQTTCHPAILPSTGSTLTEFNGTRHANADSLPDANFSQIATPVPTGRHLEECSRCHNPNQRFEFDFTGNLLKPTLDSLPAPAVACGSCHDGHQPQRQVTIPQRAAKVGYPVFRKFVVDPTTGQQVNVGTTGAVNQAAFIFQANGAAINGPINNALVVGRNNELNPDMLCAACHTKGTYKNSGQVTHQDDIHTQWAGSGHGDRNAAAFAEFAANPGAYTNENTGAPFTDLSHRTTYPIDMAISRYVTAGPATTTQNAGNNNYVCFKCHNGLTSLAYQDNVQGTPLAPVVFGDVTVTCITCHNPHRDVPGNSKNTRKPVVMSTYSAPIRTTNLATNVTLSSLKFSGNVFLDNTPVPAATGNETICVFCHQGRESAFTLFKLRLAADNTLSGSAFLNEHYLGTGAMLWARNAYEYPGKLYGENQAHQQANCNSCHMTQSGRNDLGGHSWRIFAETDGAVNNASCNASACHNGRVPATKTGLDNFRDATFDPTNDYDGNGALDGIPVEIANLARQLSDLFKSNRIDYDDLNYPYFFKQNADGTPTDHTDRNNGYTAWTLAQMKAAFNLQYVIKGLPSAAISQVGQPNPSAATHNFRYNIQLLRDAYDNLWTNEPTLRGTNPDRSAQVRPAGTRPATNYDPQTGGAYNPRQ